MRSQDRDEAVLGAVKAIAALYGDKKEFQEYVKVRELARAEGEKAKRSTRENKFATLSHLHFLVDNLYIEAYHNCQHDAVGKRLLNKAYDPE